MEAFLMSPVREDIHPLAGKVAVVTGAGRGIGAAIARQLSRLGATAVLCGRTPAALDSTAKAIAQSGGKAEALPCDVTDLHSVQPACPHSQAPSLAPPHPRH